MRLARHGSEKLKKHIFAAPGSDLRLSPRTSPHNATRAFSFQNSTLLVRRCHTSDLCRPERLSDSTYPATCCRFCTVQFLGPKSNKESDSSHGHNYSALSFRLRQLRLCHCWRRHSRYAFSKPKATLYILTGIGCVIASRLAEYLPHKKTLLIEAGPSDFMDDRVLDLKKWLHLLGGELDYDYGTTEQPMGNSNIRHSRAKVLGGCSSHNTLISFRPFKFDMDIWQSMGAKGWTFETMMRVLNNLRNTVQPVHERHRNQLCRDWVQSCSEAMNIPVIHDFNKEIINTGSLKQGVGFFSVSYNPDNGYRSSASVAYIHPILRGDEKRSNLTVLTNTWVSKINLSSDKKTVTGVNVSLNDGSKRTITPKIETILSAGAVDTPRLMLLSGLGPKEQLSSLSIPCHADLKGVGENLLDHPETIIIWELNKPVPANQTTMDSDAGIFLRREPADAAAGSKPSTNPFNPQSLAEGDIADVMMHCYQIPFTLNTTRLGYDEPVDAFCMTPNIPRPRSKGKLYLTSSDPSVKPALDFRYFTDPAGYDAATFVFGMKAARKCAQQEPFK